MTQDELLAKIGNPIYEGYEYGDIVFNKALRAVVELHKPVGNSWNKVVNCRECKATEDEYNENWPCPTILAIEKELK